MTVPTSCKNFCAQLRRMGFTEFSEDSKNMTIFISEDAMNNAAVKMQWSERTCQRYLGTEGILVKFGYLKFIGDGEYLLTGEDLNE
jgi:hypothetical protein